MLNRIRSIVCAAALSAFLCAGAPTWAAPPGFSFTYQGTLSQSGTPVDGLRDFRFRLYDVEVGGSSVATTQAFSVDIDEGIFSVEIDFGLAPWAPNDQYWLEIEVGPADMSQSYEIIGRQKLTATPYALNTRGISVDVNGSVGIGTQAPAARLDVLGLNGGSFRVFDLGPDLGAMTQLLGGWVGDDAAPQVRFQGAPGGGFVDIGQDGVGSFVIEPGDVPALVVSLDGRIGVGTGTPQSRLDVRFSEGNGIEVSDTDTASSGIGVHSIVGLGTGVRGESTAASGSHFGVYGQAASLSGWGVFSNGRLGASGTKSFMIDHPLDPTGKYLLHYSSESPEPQNRYNGNVYLNAHGVGVVALPDYFHAINRDFRYTLTPIGAPAPNLHVASEIDGNSFVVAGGAPGQKVSWEVTAVRNDAFVRQRGAPVEVEKIGAERGLYLTPWLYGMPDVMGVHHTETCR